MDSDTELNAAVNNVRAFLRDHVTGFGKDGSFINQILKVDKVLLYAMVLYSYKFDYLINNRYNESVLQSKYELFKNRKQLLQGSDSLDCLYNKKIYLSAVNYFFGNVVNFDQFVSQVFNVTNILFNCKTFAVKKAFKVKRVIVVQRHMLPDVVLLDNKKLTSFTLQSNIEDPSFSTLMGYILKKVPENHVELRNTPQEYIVLELTVVLNAGLYILPVYECTVDSNELELVLLPQEYGYRVESVKKRPPVYRVDSKDLGNDFNAADRMYHGDDGRSRVSRAIPRIEYILSAFTLMNIPLQDLF